MDFNSKFSDILSGLQIAIVKTPGSDAIEGDSECDCHKTNFDKFKEFAIQDISSKDECPCETGECSPVVQQLQNSTSMEQVEVFLKQSGYCPESLTNLYKQFIQAT